MHSVHWGRHAAAILRGKATRCVNAACKDSAGQQWGEAQHQRGDLQRRNVVVGVAVLEADEDRHHARLRQGTSRGLWLGGRRIGEGGRPVWTGEATGSYTKRNES